MRTTYGGGRNRPLYIAIAGAQGSGKTTLAEVLTEQLVLAGVSAVACSLDDFYLTRARRIELARTVHPLLITRGVPGTHDMELCSRTIDSVTRTPTAMPKFDKGLDDRVDRSMWPMAGVADVVIIEGWCLGARPQPADDLVTPINELERDEDADGRWRRYVNDALARYRRCSHASIGSCSCERRTSMRSRRWRAEQELQLPRDRRMSAPQLRRFIAHYERLTRGCWRTAGPRRPDGAARPRITRSRLSITKTRP